MEKYNRYKTLKKALDIQYHNISLNRVLAVEIWSIANQTLSLSWKSVLRFCFTFNFNALKTAEIFSTYGLYNRKDHYDLYNQVMDRVSKDIPRNNLLMINHTFSFHPLRFLRQLHKVYQHTTRLTLSQKEIWWLAAKMTYYCNTIDILEKIDFSHTKKYIAMAGVLNVENLLTQFLKNQNVKTYSLEEGLFIGFHHNIPVDCVAYENFESDRLLCWGDYTRNEFIKQGIHAQHLLVSGYPKQVSSQKTTTVKSAFKRGAILLARDSFHDANVRLLDILATYQQNHSCSFLLKLHPSLDYAFYEQFARTHAMSIAQPSQSLQECLNDHRWDFAIAVNTTAYYEALLSGKPCLRFQDETFDLPLGYADIFHDNQELQTLIDRLQKMPDDEYWAKVKEILHFVIGYGIDLYKKNIMA